MTLGRGEIFRVEYLEEPCVEYTISRSHLLASISKCLHVICMCDEGARGLLIILQYVSDFVDGSMNRRFDDKSRASEFGAVGGWEIKRTKFG